jgi:monoamine oxidase
MSRTALFAALRRAFGLAWSRQPSAPAAVRPPRLGRRRALALGLAAASLPRHALARRDARVVIVGAGLAGLATAHHLRKAGLENVTVHEANTRPGGRMYSLRDTLGPGTVAELGGSFINSDHADMLALCRDLDLKLEDGAASGADAGPSYFIAGRHRTIADIATEAEDLVARLARLRAEHQADKAAIDRVPVAAWLDRFGCTGWLRTLLDIGLTQEMGLEPDRMSGLYFTETFAPDPKLPTRGLFSSDQRYQIAGGNDRLPAALVQRLSGLVIYGQRLEAVRHAGAGVVLDFQTPGGSREVRADLVVLTLPATILRHVALRLDLPPLTRQAIRELRYGTNAKLFAGLTHRPWLAQGRGAECLNDLGVQTVWEDHARPDPAPASLTIFAGGRTGEGFGTGGAHARAQDALRRMNPAFPGLAAAFNGRASAMIWPRNPYVGGSYTCYAPGQWTRFAEAFGPSGPVVFAGEHTSNEFSGYMNGAAESGRLAAEAVLRALA